VLKVYLSPLAEKKLSLLLEYIEHEWTNKERNEFLEKILNSFHRVATYPESSPKSQAFPGLYKCVVIRPALMSDFNNVIFFHRF
jgi:plasmid stabilization system protein ParE